MPVSDHFRQNFTTHNRILYCHGWIIVLHSAYSLVFVNTNCGTPTSPYKLYALCTNYDFINRPKELLTPEVVALLTPSTNAAAARNSSSRPRPIIR